MSRTLLALLSVCFLMVGCGKNDQVVPVGQLPPPPQAPLPPGYQPPVQNPGGYYPPQQPVFRPQMPPQMPPQYYPFLPIDNYMRRTPQLQQYWIQFWAQWQQYARFRNYNQYDFNRFWFEYCPTQWSGGSHYELYSYFDQSFYHWVTPQTNFGYQNIDPGYFWANFDYYVYPEYSWGDCYDYCY